MLFSKGVRKYCYINVRSARERAGEICTRAARGARVFIKLAERRNAGKREMRKNESGEHTGNSSGEHTGGARESKRNAGQTSIWKVGGEMVET